MVVRLRFAKHGVRNNPIYHLVALSSRKRRNALPLETLGIFSPRPLLQIHRPSLIDLLRTVESQAPQDVERVQKGMAEGGERVSRKEVRWDVDRIRYWLGVGAQPSESVVKLFKVGGILNAKEDLELLRTKTTAVATPAPPPKLAVAATKRGPAGSMAKFRKRGLLPIETKFLPDGSVELPASITPNKEPLILSQTEVTTALSRASTLLQTRPHSLLNPRWPKPKPAPRGEMAKKQKRDPAAWKLRRRRRAGAWELVKGGGREEEEILKGLEGLKVGA